MALIIALQNDGTGTDESANYDVEVYVNRRKIETLRVTGHNRSDTWPVLLRRLLAVAQPNTKEDQND